MVVATFIESYQRRHYRPRQSDRRRHLTAITVGYSVERVIFAIFTYLVAFFDRFNLPTGRSMSMYRLLMMSRII